MSVVVPAFNEEKRLEAMLEEAIAYLDNAYGRSIPAAQPMQDTMDEQTKSSNVRQRGTKSVFEKTSHSGGYEILLVNDGSKDETVNVALRIAHKHGLHDILRVVTLEKNRGKGGAVVHGFRHVRGQYAIFADADGASTFEDLGKLVDGCDRVSDSWGRGVAVGSRAHMVGSEAVIKVNAILSHSISFSSLIRILLLEIRAPQRSYAQLPSAIASSYTTSYEFHPRHPMRLQTLQPGFPTLHHPLHAC